MKILKIEDPTKLPEILIYFHIDGLGSMIFTLRRAFFRGELELDNIKKDTENAQQDQEELIQILIDRGFPFEKAGDENYFKWYRWWSNWHKNTLSNEEWRELDNLMIDLKGEGTEEDYKSWRPEGDWK